jgi:hypothetical protein
MRVQFTRPLLSSLALRLLSGAIFGVALVCSCVIALLGKSYTTERLCYVLIALAVTPAALVWVLRSRRWPDTQANLLAQGTLITTTIAVLWPRLSGVPHASLAVAATLIVGELALLWGTPWLMRELPDQTFDSFIPIPVVLVLAALSLAPSGAVTIARLGLALLAAALAAWIGWRARAAAGPRARRIVDGAVLVVVILAIAQLSPIEEIRTSNMNYFLGPTNDVLNGRPMLVDTYSQYGVGVFYALAALFTLIPIGYGTYTLVLAAATVGVFVSLYLILRMALRSQVLAIAGVVSATFVYLYSIGLWQYSDFPSTGPMRFGLPWLVTLAAVAAAATTRSRRRTVLTGCVLILVAVAATWSAETGMYTLGCAVAVALVDGFSREGTPRARLSATLRAVAIVVGAAIGGWLLLNLATLVFAGQLPNWGPYIALLKLYTVSGFGLLPIGAWSQGMGVAAIYSVAAVFVTGMLALSPETVRSHLPAFRALAGVTVMGALEFTYFLGRAAPSNLIHVSAPAVTVLFLLLGTLGTLLGERTPRITAAAGLGLLACLVFAGANPYLKFKFDGTALGELINGHPSTFTAIDRLASNPVSDSTAASVAHLLDSPSLIHRKIAVIAYPIVESEALIRADRANDIESTNPCQSSLSQTAPERVLNEVRAFPVGGRVIVYSDDGQQQLVPLQGYELKLLQERFRLRPLRLAGAPANLWVFATKSTRRSWHGGVNTRRPSIVTGSPPGCA